MIDWRQSGWYKAHQHIGLECIIKSKDLLKDLVYLTDFGHTGGIEVCNSLYNKFCPKRLHLGWHGMVARTKLAVLDFISGSQCVQATTQENKNRFKLSFSNVTQNWVVKKIFKKEKQKIYWRVDGGDDQNEIWKSELQTDAYAIKCPQIFGLQS